MTKEEKKRHEVILKILSTKHERPPTWVAGYRPIKTGEAADGVNKKQ